MIPGDEVNMEGISLFITKKGKYICASCGLSLEDIKEEPYIKEVHLEFHRRLK